MRQSLAHFEKQGGQLPSAVDPAWLTLGNVRTDVPGLAPDRRVSWRAILAMLWRGITCHQAEHPAHAMRCRGQSVADAYQQMRDILLRGFQAGCDPEQDWQARALAFGGMLHTLQDSYCVAHAARIDNGDPTSPLIDMYTYPSRQHPLTTRRDGVWQDAARTAFRPDAAAAIQATVVALGYFAAQSVTSVDDFLDRYVAFRPDIRARD